MKLFNAAVLSDGRRSEHCTVTIHGRQITEIVPDDSRSIPENALTLDALRNCEKTEESMNIDLENRVLCPCFIDIHTHGAAMADTMDADPEAMDTICRFHLSHGVSTFLPTTMTASLSEYEKVFECFSRYTPPVPVTIPGLHMEGPFLSPAAAGAQPSVHLIRPDRYAVDFFKKYNQYIRLMTISPDVENIEAIYDFCNEHRIIISGGHDNSNEKEVFDALRHHMASVTHLYCCSSGITRRNTPQKHVGLTQIALMTPQLFCEVIADDCHIPPVLLDFILHCKDYRKLILVSDSLRATGMPPGTYILGNSETGVAVNVTEAVALLPGTNLFAGSITPVSRMVERLGARRQLPLEKLCYMASASAANLLGLKTKGYIAPGFDADLNILSEDGRLLATIIGHQYINIH